MKTKTMYMHTLDGRPASFDIDCNGWCYLYFVGGRNSVKLCSSLAQLRREQVDALDTPEDEQRFGYVLVKVPTGEVG